MKLLPASLTVYIPTYNRPYQLERLLKQLVHLRAQYLFEVIVSDNCSTTDPLDVAPYEQSGFRFMRSRANLGANANVIQAFQVAETDYLWIIGDDDLPSDDSLAIIASDLERGYDLVNYEFNDSGRPRKRAHPKTGSGIRSFLADMDYLAAALFLSTNIYRLNAFIPFLRYGFDAIFPCMPHLAMTLAALKQSPSVRYLYSDKSVVMNGWESTPAELRWNYAQLAPRFPAITQVLELTDDDRSLLQRKILECLQPGPFIEEIRLSKHFSAKAKAAALQRYRCEFRGLISPLTSFRLWAMGNLPWVINWRRQRADSRTNREGRLE